MKQSGSRKAEIGNPRGAMAEETLPGIDPAAMAAASAVAPDPLTAAILAKHAAGTTLTPQECGKLGAYKRRASGAPVGRPRKDGSPAQPSHPAAALGRPPVAGQPPPEGAGDSLPAPPADPLLISRTVGPVLDRVDKITQGYVRKTTLSIGGNEALASEYCQMAALPAESQALLKELAPVMADGYGVNARNVPTLAVVVTVLGWLVGIGMVIFNLNRLAKDHAKIFEKAAAGPNPIAAPETPPAAN